MIRADQIPPEVVEALARCENEMDFIAGGEEPPPFEQLGRHIIAWRLKRARASLVAAINAWPEAEARPTFTPSRFILPLPQEPRDE